MTVVRYGRCTATTPGKHGLRDYKVSIGNVSPTHAELVFMLGMALIAEDRYSEKWQLGRYMLWIYVDLLTSAKTPGRVIEVAEDCALAVSDVA